MAGNSVVVPSTGPASEMAPNPEGESCATCFYARIVKLEGMMKPTLVCRRNPPVPLLQTVVLPPDIRNPGGVMGQTLTGFQSPVKPDTWCGEWTDASEPAPEAE